MEKINVIKVLRGSMKPGLNLYNVTQDKAEKFEVKAKASKSKKDEKDEKSEK